MLTDQFEVYGPDGGAVTAWATDYVRHQPKGWQKALATEITARCGKLDPEDGKLLHATFFGKKDDKADVENLVLYNIGSFGKATGNGIRFEHGSAALIAPSGKSYPFCYRYDLIAKGEGFRDWQPGKTLASFDWISLGEFKGEKLAAPVWLALARAYEADRVEVFHSDFLPGTGFAVSVQIRPPEKNTRVLGNMVKGIVDGLVSAFQFHSDMNILGRIVPSLTSTIQAASPALEADLAEVERHLREQRRGLLGEVARLVRPHGSSGVAFAPDDHLCVAGEITLVDPPDPRHWAIMGKVVELTPRQNG